MALKYRTTEVPQSPYHNIFYIFYIIIMTKAFQTSPLTLYSIGLVTEAFMAFNQCLKMYLCIIL